MNNSFQSPQPAQIAHAAARAKFGANNSFLVAWAPGRINIIGEHTDYNDGFVTPIAIDKVAAIAGTVHTESLDVHLYATHFNQSADFSAQQPPTHAHPQNLPLWARYISGVIAAFREKNLPIQGFSAAIAGDVPLGSGMSSSAALVVAAAVWLNAAFSLQLSLTQIAELAHEGEIIGSGVRVGLLDHLASALGKEGSAVLIDCRSLEYRYIPFQMSDVTLLSCESGVERSLAASAYNQRRSECETAAAALSAAIQLEQPTRKITALRDGSDYDLLRLGGRIPEIPRRRARHVISENNRVLSAVEAMENNHPQNLGDLILRSHASLRDDFEVSCAELDIIVELATRSGAYGARLTGAGFGGSALIFAPNSAVATIKNTLDGEYMQRCGKQSRIHDVTPAGGPNSVWL